MTNSSDAAEPGGAVVRCRWCRREVIRTAGPGRPREFCSQRCRQWDWVSRQRSADLALGANELVVRRDELDQLHDDLYMLTTAVEDVTRDLAEFGKPSNSEYREALEWIMQAAQPLCNREVGPAA